MLTLLVLAAVAAVAAVATGRITGGLDDPVSSLPARPLPEGEVEAADVERVRFSPALRGYRMEEVDATLDRLVAELARREETIRELRARLEQPAVPAGQPLTHPAAHPAAHPAVQPVAPPFAPPAGLPSAEA